MKKVAKLFLNSALTVLGALGLASQSTGTAQAGDPHETTAGEKTSTFPAYIGAPGSQAGKPETYLNTAKIWTKEKMADSLFGGNRAWRVDKKKTKTIPGPSSGPSSPNSKSK